MNQIETERLLNDASACLNDASALESFIENDKLLKLLSHWNYYGKVNNHSVFSKLTLLLNDVSNCFNNLHQGEKITLFYLDLLSPSSLKLVYRCLNQKKASLTNSMLQLLLNLVQSQRLVNHFLNNFNLDLGFLPSLLANLDSIRSNFIRFWLGFNTNLNYFDRKNLLDSKIWYNIFKNMSNDPEDITNAIIKFIDEKVLQESNFKKSTKVKFLNETCLFNLQLLVDKNDNIVNLFHKVVDKHTGIIFSEPGNYVMTINQKNFKINNKTLFNLLKFIKLDSINKINLVLLILQHDYNLIDPYMNHIITNGGYNDPNLTSWYLSHTYLYIKVLNLPTFQLPHILLKPLLKSSLTKGIESKNSLILELNLQMIYLMVKKLDHVSDRKQINNVLAQLPDISVYLSITSPNKSTNLLVLKILNYYSLHLNQLNNTLVKHLNTQLNSFVEDFDEFKLLKLNYILSIQLNLNDKFELKWFSKNGSNNLFTNLIKFSNENDNPVYFYNLTNKLVEVEDVLILNPIWPLIYLKFPPQLFNLLDEIVLKLVNNPFKYIDLDFNVNTFVIIMFEQFKFFISKNTLAEELKAWFKLYSQSLVILGEDPIELQRLIEFYGIPITPNLDFSISQEPLNESMGESVISKNNNDLKLSHFNKKVCTNDYDLLCILKKINLIINDRTLSNQEDIILELFSNFTNYINPSNQHYLGNLKLFSSFIPAHQQIGTNQKLVLRLLDDFILKLPRDIFINEVNPFMFQFLQENDLPEYYRFNYLLTNSQLNHRFQEPLYLKNLQLLISRSIDPEISLKELFKFNNSQVLPIIKSKLNSGNLSQFIPIIIEKQYFELLDIDLNDDVIEYINNLDLDKSSRCLMGSILKPKDHRLSPFFQKVSLDNSQLPYGQYLKLFRNCVRFGNFNKIDLFHNLFTDLDFNESYNSVFVDIVNDFKDLENEDISQKIDDWMNKSMVHITSHVSMKRLDSELRNFFKKLSTLLPGNLPTTLINAQLEVFLSSAFINLCDVLEYCNHLISCQPKLSSERLLQIFLINKNNVLNGLPNKDNKLSRIETSMIIFNLFRKNRKKNANIGDKLLTWYMGSLNFEDLILKKVLKEIETIRNSSWIHKVVDWEINEFSEQDMELVGEQRLIDEIKNQGLLISLNQTFIKNALNSNLRFEIPDDYHEIRNYINENLFKLSYNYMDTIYDYEFLILLVINNDEFFDTKEDIKVNFKNLVNYNILQMLVKHFKNPICQVIINSLLKHIDSDITFKDKTLFKVYLSNLINSQDLSDIQLTVYGGLIPILSNPGHVLYEICYRYILSNPSIKGLPLFGKIKEQSTKSIEWYLRHFTQVVSSDLPILNHFNFIEWILNLLNLPNVSKSFVTLTLDILFRLQNVNSGSINLITKYAIMGFLEQLSTLNQFNLNLYEIALRFGITNSKRALEWSNHDIIPHIKRVKASTD